MPNNIVYYLNNLLLDWKIIRTFWVREPYMGCIVSKCTCYCYLYWFMLNNLMFCATICDRLKGYWKKLNSHYTCLASYENAFVNNIHMDWAFLNDFLCIIWSPCLVYHSRIIFRNSITLFRFLAMASNFQMIF